MNMALLAQMVKVHMKGILKLALGSAFYMLLMVWVFPTIADNTKAIDELMKTLPKGFSDAFGLESGFASFEGYISGEFYGVLMTLILTIFCVTKSTQLIARLIDQGSMAYILSAPTTRVKVAVTQALVLVIGLFVIVLCTTGAGFLGFTLFIDDASSVDGSQFFQLNVAAFLLFFAVSGLCFLVSCVTNDEKKALGASGFIAFGFFILDIVSKVSEKLEVFRYVTIYTFYTPIDIVTGEADLLWQGLVLVAVGLVGFVAGIVCFRKRDLLL